jgi:Dolichyl-phosphate-mannose-protein mannosyltransferase
MSGPPQAETRLAQSHRSSSLKDYGVLASLTIVAFVIMGYHPGLEDDAFYLAAIKRNLNPALFPHDADFFRLQFQATIFDKLIALSVRVTHLPLAWVVLLWQLAAIFFILHGCWRIGRRCFSEPPAQWAAVAAVAALLTIPVTGTGINIADQYLHPRNLATALIVAAIADVIDRRRWRAGVLLTVAFLIHALMAAFGISLCAFLMWKQRVPSAQRPAAPIAPFLVPLGLAIPLKWVFEPASDAWRQAAATRSFYFVGRWHWYEWLGVFAPIVLLYVFNRWQRERAERDSVLSLFTSSLVAYGIFQTVGGLIIMLTPDLERMRPFEPMRYLYLIYLFFFLFTGGLLGRYVLKAKMYRWFLFFIPLGCGMLYAQQEMYPASPHIELPGVASGNPWLQAFAWIRVNTPVDALFAIDPHYMTLPGEDYHGFRALAERSVLADIDKDGGMAARVPRLAPRWLKEVDAQRGWKEFHEKDFQRLENEFGVNWIILSKTDAIVANASGFGSLIPDPMSVLASHHPPITCPYTNSQFLVCRLY